MCFLPGTIHDIQKKALWHDARFQANTANCQYTDAAD